MCGHLEVAEPIVTRGSNLCAGKDTMDAIITSIGRMHQKSLCTGGKFISFVPGTKDFNKKRLQTRFTRYQDNVA